MGSPRTFKKYGKAGILMSDAVPNFHGLADDITLAQQATIRSVEDAGVPVAMRLTLPNGSKVYMNGYWTMSNLPNIQTGQINSRRVGFALTSLPTEYSS